MAQKQLSRPCCTGTRPAQCCRREEIRGRYEEEDAYSVGEQTDYV